MVSKEQHDLLVSALQRHHWQEARHALQGMLRVLPAEPSLQFTLGSVLRNLCRTDAGLTTVQLRTLLAEASSCYENAMRLRP